MTIDHVWLEALDVLESWGDLWRYPELFRQQMAARHTEFPGDLTPTRLALNTLASPVAATQVFRAFLRCGDFAAADSLLSSQRFLDELALNRQDLAQLRAELESALTIDKRRLHIVAEGLRLRALRTGQLDSQLEHKLTEAVTASEHSRQRSESLLRDLDRRLTETGPPAQVEMPLVAHRRWPYTDSPARVCGWFLGEQRGPADAASWAPATDETDGKHFLRQLKNFYEQAGEGKADPSAAANLATAIQRLLGFIEQPPAAAVQVQEGQFLSVLRGLDSPWLPELSQADFPNGVPLLIVLEGNQVLAPHSLPQTPFLFLGIGAAEATERPTRSLQITPGTFFSMLRDKADRAWRFLAEIGAQLPCDLVRPALSEPLSDVSGPDNQRRSVHESRIAIHRRLAALGIHELQPAAEILDRLAFFCGGLICLENRLVWEIVQRQRVFRRKRQARLDMEGVHSAYEGHRFQEFAHGQLFGPLESSPAERLVLGSLCEATGVDLLQYPVSVTDLKVWLAMSERPLPEAELLSAVRSLIFRGLLVEGSSSGLTEETVRSVRLPANGVGHMILRHFAAHEHARVYLDSAYRALTALSKERIEQ